MRQPTPTPADQVVSALLPLHCDDELGRPMTFMATFAFDTGDPFAVDFTLHLPAGDMPWRVGRALLQQGLTRAAGEGAVRVRPGTDADGRAVVHLDLFSLLGRMRAEVRTLDLVGFLARTWQVVSPGTETERYDLDALVAVLLG